MAQPMSFRRAALLCGTALVGHGAALAQGVAPGLAPNARPQGGQVVAGSASIQQTPAITQVNQASQRAAIDWRSFDVGRDHSVQFRQPAADAIALNRVTGPDPSTIAGRISANGQIVLINQSGVVFSQGAQVEARSLIVSTSDIANAAFMAGGSRLAFDRPGRPGARIENNGTITVNEAGLAALVAPQVANRGTINARLGRVVLAGAEAHTIDLYGDGLLSLEITGPVRTAPGGATALVTNTGVIQAEGGSVRLTAAAADGIVQDLVRAGGRIAANTDPATGRTGRVLVAGTGGSVRVEGEVTATGLAASARGGSVRIVGDRVQLAGTARVDVSGGAGGGRVALGASQRGSRVRLAHRTEVAAGAEVRADATMRGDGGRVLINSTQQTTFAGSVTARGGPQGGNGGAIEISGRQGFAVTGTIDAGAPRGTIGTVLFDPTNLAIVAPGDTPAGFDATVSNVTVNTTVGAQTYQADNNLSVLAPINRTIAGGVTLQAGNTITIDAGVTLTAADLTLFARSIAINQPVSVPNNQVVLRELPPDVGPLGSVTATGAGTIAAATLTQTFGMTDSRFAGISLPGDNRIGTIGQLFVSQTGVQVRNVVPLAVSGTIDAGGGGIALDVAGGGFTLGGALSADGGTATVAVRATGNIAGQAGSSVTSAGISLQAGFDFTAGAVNPASTASITLAGNLLNLNPASPSAGVAGTTLLAAPLGGIAQTGGQIAVGTLNVRSGADAILAGSTNTVQTLGGSTVLGNLNLNDNGTGTLNLAGDIRVDGLFTLTKTSGFPTIQEQAGARLLVNQLNLSTSGFANLTGDNRIVEVTGYDAQFGSIRNVTSLRITGATSFNNTVAQIDVVGGNLSVEAAVRGANGATLRATGNIQVTGTGSVAAFNNGTTLQLLAGYDFAAGQPNPNAAGGLTLAGTVGSAATPNTNITLAGGTSGIVQTGGQISGNALTVQSGGDALLDRGGSQTGALNRVTSLTGSAVGDFVLDNGSGDFTLIAGGTAGVAVSGANVGLRTTGVLTFRGSVEADGTASFRTAALVLNGNTVTAQTIEVAPAVPTAVVVPGPSLESNVPFTLTTGELALLQASSTLRFGATTFRGVTTTTATSFNIAGNLTFPGIVDLRSLGAVTQDAGANLNVGTLTGVVGGLATLTNTGNRVNALADFSAVSGLSLTDAVPLNIVGSVSSPQTVQLNVTGALTETGVGRIAAGVLGLAVSGAVDLPGANAVVQLATAGAGTTFALNDTVPLTLTGSLTAPQSVRLTVVGGLDETGAGRIATPMLNVSATGAVALGGGNAVDQLGTSSAGTTFALNDTVPLNLTGNLAAPQSVQLTVAGNLGETGAGRIATTLLSVSATGAVNLGGDNAVVQLGNGGAGTTFLLNDTVPLTLTGSLVAPRSVQLTVAGGLDEIGAGRIATQLLNVSATGAVALAGDNAVDRLGPATAGTSFALNDGVPLTLTGTLAAPQSVQLTVAGNLGETGAGRIATALLTVSATGAVDLPGANAVAQLGNGGAGTSFVLSDDVALLSVPAGRTVNAGTTLSLSNSGDLTIDGTVTGTTTALTVGGTLTVNGFSAIARSGNLNLRANRVVTTGLIAAAGSILLNATTAAQLGGQARATSGSLQVTSPSIVFTGLNAANTPVLLLLGTAGSASGSLNALGLNVAGGAGANLTGTIAGVAGGGAAALGQRSTATGTPQPDPPRPTDFLFNDCPIAIAVCIPVVIMMPPPPPPPPPPPVIVANDEPPLDIVTVISNPEIVVGELSPGFLIAAFAALRPATPDIAFDMTRDRSEESELAPPNVRGEDF